MRVWFDLLPQAWPIGARMLTMLLYLPMCDLQVGMQG